MYYQIISDKEFIKIIKFVDDYNLILNDEFLIRSYKITKIFFYFFEDKTEINEDILKKLKKAWRINNVIVLILMMKKIIENSICFFSNINCVLGYRITV